MIDRVPPIVPLTRAQTVVVALLENGYSLEEGARLMGIEAGTFRVHVTNALAKVPGDLRATSRLVAWWRGADRTVLGVGHALALRQDALKQAYAISIFPRCVTCGTLVLHGNGEPTTGGHQ